MKTKILKLPIKGNYPAVTLGVGYFDGLHLGHQELIKKVLQEAKKTGTKSAIFTFSPFMHRVLGKKYLDGELTPLEFKLEKLKQLGIELCYILDFNMEMAKLSPEVFLETVLKPLNIKTIICGSDFRFGHLGKGGIKELNATFKTLVVPLLEVRNQKVSSTTIYQYLKEGKVQEIPDFLGDYYTFIGTVIKGLGNGKKLGINTANMEADAFVLPKNGVYKVRVQVQGKEYWGLANVGCHPSIDKLSKNIVEVHILNFNQQIYGQVMRVKFYEFIREERKFAGLEELKKQIKLDTFLHFKD